jgi:hypothetical protein
MVGQPASSQFSQSLQKSCTHTIFGVRFPRWRTRPRLHDALIRISGGDPVTTFGATRASNNELSPLCGKLDFAVLGSHLACIPRFQGCGGHMLFRLITLIRMRGSRL